MPHASCGGRARAREDFGTDPIVVAYGAGVDSTPLLIGLRDRGIRIDLILFADTGSEKPETVAYLPIIGDWLNRQGMPPIRRGKRHSPRAGDVSLHDECLRKSVLPSLAYGGHSCSLKWKVEPQRAFTRDFFGWDRQQQRWPHGSFITKLIGYDAGPADARRIANAAVKWRPGHRYRYPLMERGWTRDICEQVILRDGLPLPMKSACWMSLRCHSTCFARGTFGSSAPPRRSTRSSGWPRRIPISPRRPSRWNGAHTSEASPKRKDWADAGPGRSISARAIPA